MKAKRCVPPIADWHTYAGGTFCPDRSHGFSAHPSIGNYKINPVCQNMHQNGYSLMFENVKSASKFPGLHQHVGNFRSAASAAKAANAHCGQVHAGLAGSRRRRRRRR